MRTSRIGGLLTLLLAAPAALRADQPAKFVATVTISPGTQIQSGPSWQYHPAGQLKKGEQVFVHHEDNGWLAILPPPGSVSWVNHRFIGEYDPAAPGKQNAVIMGNTEARVGNEIKDGPLPVKQVTLPAGTIVTIVGPKMRFENSTWYPIEPPADEYRWIAKNNVGPLQAAPPPPVVVKNPQAVPESPVKPAVAQRPVPETPQPPPNTAAAHPAWAKAEQAEQNGDWGEAERLYTQVYTDLRKKSADIDQLLACYNRIDRCRERQRNGVNIPLPAPGANSGTGAAGGSTSGRGPATLSPPSEQGAAAWPTNSSPAPEPSVSAAPPAAVAPEESKPTSAGPGYLRKAPFFIDNRQAYALEVDAGKRLYYVTAQGVNLDSYLNRPVELVGVPQVRGDIRGAQYMVVTKVIPH